MKKKQKKSKKSKKNKRLIKKKLHSKRLKKTYKKIKKIYKKKFTKTKKRKLKNIKKQSIHRNIKKTQNENLVLKLVKLQLSLKPKFNFQINFKLEKYIQGFFDKISETISNYKILKENEKRRLKLERIENERKAKIAIEKQKKDEEILKARLKEQALKDEVRLEKQRTKDIKLFLRKEQAL